MKKLSLKALCALLVLSCDPVSDMEANIENLTEEPLTVEFISFDTSLNKTLDIAPDETVLFQEGFDIGSTFLEPSMTEYDSVVVRNASDAILRIYKENQTGKNIYNVSDDWIGREPSKRFFRYKYQIETEELD